MVHANDCLTLSDPHDQHSTALYLVAAARSEIYEEDRVARSCHRQDGTTTVRLAHLPVVCRHLYRVH